MLSNTATPKYYGMFRDKVLSGEIPVNETVSMQMNLIDDLIRNPNVYYDDKAVDGFVKFCENELVLTDGSDLKLLDTFKLWAEDILGWYYFIDRSVPIVKNGEVIRYENRKVKKRLRNKQYLIVARGSLLRLFIVLVFTNIS